MSITDQKILESLLEKRKQLKEEIAKVELAISAFGGESNFVFHSYPLNGSWSDKIFYALKDIKSGLISEIIEVIKTEEPELDVKKITTTISQYCPILYKQGRLSRIKQGNKFKYSIK